MRESMGGDFFQEGGGGVSLNIIIMWVGVEINFWLNEGGYIWKRLYMEGLIFGILR